MHHSSATYNYRCIYSVTYSTATPWRRSEGRAVAVTTGAALPATGRTPAGTCDIPARGIVFGPSVTDGPSGKLFSAQGNLYPPDVTAMIGGVDETSPTLLRPFPDGVRLGHRKDAATQPVLNGISMIAPSLTGLRAPMPWVRDRKGAL